MRFSPLQRMFCGNKLLAHRHTDILSVYWSAVLSENKSVLFLGDWTEEERKNFGELALFTEGMLPLSPDFSFHLP